MPYTENYEAKYWFQTPEPFCKPGYTGYIPGYGPKRLFQFGRTYGEMTHILLKDHPVAGLRLANIVDCSQALQEKLEREILMWMHEKNSENTKRSRTLMAGYTGYVPRRKFIYGKSFSDECNEATALMEKLKLVIQ